MAIFEITVADGSVHVGVPMGNGGRLGGGASHLGMERESQAALRELQHLIKQKQMIVLQPATSGDVPHEIIAQRTKKLWLNGASAKIVTFDEVRGQILHGSPYPNLD